MVLPGDRGSLGESSEDVFARISVDITDVLERYFRVIGARLVSQARMCLLGLPGISRT